MHKQRVSVLLLLVCMVYSILYMMYYLPYNLTYLLDVDLLTVSSSVFNISFVLDSVSLSFSSLVTFISFCVFMFARTYMASDLFYYRFIYILLSFVLSMNMLILSGSFLILLVGWDGLGVSSFALIIYYQSKESLVSGFLTLLINRLGDIIIMSMAFFFTVGGMMLLFSYPMTLQYTMLALLSVGALTKSAQYPFSVWLPAAMAAPTPVSALVHSSTLVTAGVYIIIRACLSMQLPSEVLSLLLFCGSVTSLLGGMCAIVENDLKKIIALSTLSQLGVMVFCLGLGSYNLALLHLYTHAMFKALLFLVAGSILLLSYGIQDIRLLGAVTRKAPLLLVFMNVSAFCLMGLPFMSAFYSKHVILSLMWFSKVNMLSIVMMMMSTGLTGLYMVRLIKALNWASQNQSIVSSPMPLTFYTPLCLLFVGSLSSGMMFSCMDMGLPLSLYIPQVNEAIVSLMVLMGVYVGTILAFRLKVSFLTNMLYLVPLWYNLPSVYNQLSTQLKYLDKGWLEPYCVNNTIKNSVLVTMKYSSWPKSSFNYLPYMFLMSGSSILLWVSLK